MRGPPVSEFQPGDRHIGLLCYRIIIDGGLYRIRMGLGQLMRTPSGRARYWKTRAAAEQFLDELERKK